jgi:hypothetical protein
MFGKVRNCDTAGAVAGRQPLVAAPSTAPAVAAQATHAVYINAASAAADGTLFLDTDLYTTPNAERGRDLQCLDLQ